MKSNEFRAWAASWAEAPIDDKGTDWTREEVAKFDPAAAELYWQMHRARVALAVYMKGRFDKRSA